MNTNNDNPRFCCGAVRDTRFCPDCGKQLDEEPTDALMRYLRTMESKALKTAEGHREGAACLEETEARRKDYAERMQTSLRCAERFSGYAESLVALIDEVHAYRKAKRPRKSKNEAPA